MFRKKGKKLHRGSSGGGTETGFTQLIAEALKSEQGTTHQAIKTVVGWTGASERTVKHWFAGTHGPRGEHLVALARHSDAVLKVFLVLAERNSTMVAAKLVDLRMRLLETVDYIEQQM